MGYPYPFFGTLPVAVKIAALQEEQQLVPHHWHKSTPNSGFIRLVAPVPTPGCVQKS